jgi:putative oxidoreductase
MIAGKDPLLVHHRMLYGRAMFQRIIYSTASPWTILIRLAVGLVVFFPEGIQKLVFPDILGAGRFAKIGIPYPELIGPFVGGVELVCGVLIIVGLFTRLASIPLIVTMIVALIATKLPILLGHGFGPFSLPDFKRYGFWSAQHESRADLTMLLGCLYLLAVGSGRWSIDRLLDQSAADRTGTERI